jgi:uncharacterized protein (DUF697 family)
MNAYDRQAFAEMQAWRRAMQRPPTLSGRLTRRVQERINELIPERVHEFITAAFKKMTQAVLAGSDFVTADPVKEGSLQVREDRVQDRIQFYKTAAAAEGAVTGFGGILLGLADFPLWLTLKMKMLFDIAALYGHDTGELAERLYILHVFQLAFSSRQHRKKIFADVAGWDARMREKKADIESIDWRAFQQEYRDYIDLAKLLQLVPGIGAAVGAVVNHRYTEKLGRTAMNAYRMRGFMR